ncbi:MAG: muramidase [Firmicutes bacterium HGW-Firmicutes-12]|jgi:flagellar protein FlgJ|nr:MAG: muramidase [Firmicutes bacterium HGW-Firmicutes-12]
MKIDATGFSQDIGRIAQNSYQNKTNSDFQKVLEQAKESGQDDQKLREACLGIEAMFIHQMLTQMRATVPQGGLIKESNAEKIYRDMLDERYSEIMAKSTNNLGLADMVYNQLKAQESANTENGNTKE